LIADLQVRAETNSQISGREEGTMPQVENLQNSAQHCFDLAIAGGFLEADIAAEAFELLTANDYDRILAHGLDLAL